VARGPRGDDGIDSDIDLLVAFESGVTLFDVEELRLEL
jgi:predicted nucleotidyltransferase